MVGGNKIRKVSKATQRIEDRYEQRISKEFEKSLEKIRQRLIDLDYDEYFRELTPEVTENDLEELVAALALAVLAGARSVGDDLGNIPTPRGTLRINYNPLDDAVVGFARSIAVERMGALVADVREVINYSISSSIQVGLKRDEISRRVRNSIGLTTQQAQALDNYRKELSNMSSSALSRELRDPDFDSTFMSTRASGNKLSQRQIDRMVEAYRKRLIKHRAGVIGQTEALRAVQGGRYHQIKAYIDAGLVRAEQIRGFWRYVHDNRVRAAHSAIPGMNPDGQPHGSPFVTPLGPLKFPGDPMGIAENVINCRCSVEYRVVEVDE